MLYVKREKISKVWPLFAADEKQKSDIRKFEEVGTHSAAPRLAIGEAMLFHNGIGAKRKEARLRYLSRYWMDKLKDIPKVRFNTSFDPNQMCAIGNVQIEGLDVDPGPLCDLLGDLGVQIGTDGDLTVDVPAALRLCRKQGLLERNLDLKRRYVECFEWTDSPYTPLLDDFEPFMETREVAEVFAAIRRINAEGTAVLLVEQNVALAMAMASRAYVLEEGRIVAEGAPQDLLARPEIQRAYLGV
jgi:hypothetical protein